MSFAINKSANAFRLFLSLLLYASTIPAWASDYNDIAEILSQANSPCQTSSEVQLISDPHSKTLAQDRLLALQNIKDCIALSMAQISQAKMQLHVTSVSTGLAQRRASDQLESQLESDQLESQLQALKNAEKVVSSQIENEKQKTDFLGTTFGTAFGFSAGKERVTAAEIASDGTIRATKTVKHIPRIVLEVHTYICMLAGTDCNTARSGTGPFFALVADNNSISSFGFGIMHGWRDENSDDPSSGFSIAIGAVLDESVTHLASGFVVGQAPPAGETSVKFATKSSWSPLVIFSRTF